MDKQKKTPDEWVTEVQQRIQDAEDWNGKRQILAQVNYYLGNQWIYWNPTARRMMTAPIEDGQERITHNVIKPRVMVKIAKQTKNRIKYDVMPDTNSQNRIEIARGAQKFLHYWWEEEELDKKTRDIFLNNAVKGWCAAKVFFDAEAGQEIPSDEEEKLYTGEIRCRIVDPLSLYIDPAATTDDEIRWIIERRPRDVDYIKEKYKKEVTPDENVDYVGNYDIGTTQTGIGTNQKSRKTKNMAMVDEMWLKPCVKYPHGLKVTVSGQTLLDVEEKAGDLPYFLFGDIPVPGSVKYDAFIKDMLPIQRNINIIKSMLATHAKRMGNSLWLIPYGSGVDDEDVTNEEGGMIHFNPSNGMKPERVSPPDLPSFYDRIIEYGTRDIDDMSGAREISQGRLPSGLDTYSGLQLMVEQENEKLAVSAQNYERGMKKLLKRVLILMKKHYTEERLGRILGEGNEVELVAFTGAELSGGEDINIVQGSSLPETKAAQEQRIMDLWREQAIVRDDGTPDHETLLRLLGMGDSTELFEMRQLDENKAKMENKIFIALGESPEGLQVVQQYQAQIQQMDMLLQQGIQVPEPPIPEGLPIVRDFYDHNVHIYQHNIFRKSSEYEQLPKPVQLMVDAHVAEHVAQMQAPMIQQQQQQREQEMVAQEQASMEGDINHQRNMEQMQMKHQMELQRESIKQSGRS